MRIAVSSSSAGLYSSPRIILSYSRIKIQNLLFAPAGLQSAGHRSPICKRVAERAITSLWYGTWIAQTALPSPRHPRVAGTKTGAPQKAERPAAFSYENLLDDLGNDAGTDRSAAFTDSEAEAFFHCDRLDQGHIDLDVVAGHDHLDAFGQLDGTGNVSRADEELRTVVVEERV